jgi:hypothetical protein
MAPVFLVQRDSLFVIWGGFVGSAMNSRMSETGK